MWAHQYINADWGFAWSRSSSAYWLLALICTTTCERTPRPLCPAGTATSSPAWRKAPVQFLCLRLKWMAAFEECATFTCFVSVFTCRTRLFSALKEKGRHASLIIHRLSAPLPRSLLWVQHKGRNQLPWIQLPQWGGGGVSWCKRGSAVRDRVSVLILLRCRLPFNRGWRLFSKLQLLQCLPTPRFILIHSTLNCLGYTKTTTDIC